MRNLGLVPVASPESFEWPGRFLGLQRDSSTWAVFFTHIFPREILRSHDYLAAVGREKRG
jgi:hypothetical protein